MKVVICFYIHCTSSFLLSDAKLRVFRLSSLSLHPSQHYFIKDESLQPTSGPIPVFVKHSSSSRVESQILLSDFALFGDKTWRACHQGEQSGQQKATVPQERDSCPVFKTESRRKGIVPWFSDLVAGIPLLL